MSNIEPEKSKEIPVEQWAEWCVEFTRDNHGRLVDIEIVGEDVGAQPLTDDAALVALDYDTAGKGNDFVLTYGSVERPLRHVIRGPVSLWEAKDAEGKVVSLEIEDDRGWNTIVTLL